MAEYHLNHQEFDEFNKCISESEKALEKEKVNDKFKEKITQLTEAKNEKYKIYNKNKLYFYTSEPLFYSEYNKEDDTHKLIPLKTEANNSFYLKYNLQLKMPKDMEIIFEFMEKDFLDFLKNKFQNPSKFIYIGSDHFDIEGNLFYSDKSDSKAIYFSSKMFENEIKKFKNKADMVILGFINSQTIAEYFIKNNFPNVVYLKKLDILTKLIKKYHYFYFYFQRCFFDFVINFLINLGKKEIKEAFVESEEEFKNQLSKFGKLYEGEINEQIKTLNAHKIIEYEFKTGEEKKNIFEELNISRSNSLSNNNNTINEINNENAYNTTDTSQNEKKNVIKIDYDDINLKFDDKLNDCIFEYLINKRYYGNKNILNEAITKILDHKIVNIHGGKQTGKTTLCLELCKYFYMNNYFQSGIYYINNINNKKWDQKEEFKELKNKISDKKDNINENTLIIFDDKNNFNSCQNYLSNDSLYIVIVSTEPLNNPVKKRSDKRSLTGKQNKKRKLSSITETQDSINNIFNININKNLGNNFREEFFNYMRINLFLNNKKLSKNTENNFDLIKDKDEVYINDIVKLFSKDF